MSAQIAIVGMAGRFPGAPDLDAFWRNLRGSVDAIRRFSIDELRTSALMPQLIDLPDYVPAGAPLDGAELFDAGFFEINPREAERTDPQHRLFLECAWECLEHAGYDPARFPGMVGVFGGAAMSGYTQLFPFATGALDGMIQYLIGNASDYLTTRVSYKLNLRGPSINVQTACSTSLVAIHLACQSLLGGECELALAGGVAVRVTQHEGYVHQPGLTSSDGRCRAFDADGQGTVFGNGVGLVALRRLDDALAAGDTVYGVIRGSAVNNDGILKAGFTAPSVEGQAEVIAEALAVAGITADQLAYVEAHGTATPLGDPIEVAALTKAFRASTARRGFCALGSVKSNIGHLESAAGIAGLLKTTLALHHAELPASLHFERANPGLELDHSPFFVNAELRAWPRGEHPRYAGVSSFGIGGTNAHVVVEEAPLLPATGAHRSEQLLVLSARSDAALQVASERLAAALAAHPELALADVAHTLQVGRAELPRRRAIVARDRDQAIARLRADDDPIRSVAERVDRPVVFMFPGAGAQYAHMAGDLYRREPVFRAELDRCHEILVRRTGKDLLAILYPDHDDRRLTRTSTALPALIAVEYALAQLWRSFGLTPTAMIGHSVSEYVPACLADVISLEDMLCLVARRGELFEQLQGGGMLGVPLEEAALRALMPDTLAIAALNAPGMSVVSGANEPLDAFAATLAVRGVEAQRLHIDVAAHSPLVDPILAEFGAFVSTLSLRPPQIPFVSNVTGSFITEAQATDPAYWVSQLRNTVRFADGVRTLLADPARVFLEVGPGRTLGTFVRQHRAHRPDVATSLPHAQDSHPDLDHLLGNLGRLWTAGVSIDWRSVQGPGLRRRVALPTYPFERKRYWPAQVPRTSAAAEPADAPAAMYERPELGVAFEPPVGEREQEVAAIWQRVLGLERIGRRDNFFELGGHSLLIAQLLAPLRERYRTELLVRALFMNPTIAGFASAIDQAPAGAHEAAGVNPAEIVLPADIQPVPERPRPDGQPETYLLTGATGFLGVFLLEELCARTDARIVCLVRADDPAHAMARLEQNLQRHRISLPGLRERVEALPGDLAAPRLGLDAAVFARLAETIDAIYHAGAHVNFAYPYEALKASNVGGTIEVLRLAATYRQKPLHFISTTGVFTATACAGQRVDEQDALAHHAGLHTGYVETKWVAERVLHLARARGIPVAIYRPAAVAGHPQTGASNRADFLLAMVRGCIALAAVPDVDNPIYIAPVDFVVAAIVALSRHSESLGHVFHTTSPQPVPLAAQFAALRRLGYPLEELSFAAWHDRLRAAVADEPAHPLAGYLIGGQTPLAPPIIDCTATTARLAELGLHCPANDDAALERTCRKLVDAGYLQPPPAPLPLVSAPRLVPARSSTPVSTPTPLGGPSTMPSNLYTAAKNLLGQDWAWGFRLGLFDLFMPINYDQSLQRAFEILQPAPDARIVDAGSGSGRLVVHAGGWLAAGGQLTCVDVDKGGLVFSAKRATAMGVADRVSHHQHDLRTLASAGLAPFDGAISHFSVYCLSSDQDRQLAVAQIAAVLRPGARLVIAVPSEGYEAHRLIADACRVERSRTDAPRWKRSLRTRVIYPITEIATGRLQKAMEQGRFHRYSERELETHLRTAGFSHIDISATYGGCGYVATAERTAAARITA